MPHLDPEQLSLLALYEDWQDDDGRRHLAGCAQCAADYAALRRTVEAVKTTPDASTLSVPGPQVWAGIHRELGLGPALAGDPLADADAGPDAGPRPSAEVPASRTPASKTPASKTDVPAPNVVPLTPRKHAGRPRATWWERGGTWIAAAAAAVLVVGGALWAFNRQAEPQPPAPQYLAEAQLTPLAQYTATGSARVVEGADGSRNLEVTLDKDEAHGYQEVWLIAPDLSRLVSLGVMNTDSGTFQLPPGLQLADYPIVDVSDEPVDGNPAHSSVSIVRGTLTS